MAFAQGRNADFHHAKTIVEVLAEGTGGDGLLQVPVGCRDDPDIDRAGPRFTHAHDLALLQDAEQFQLHGGGRVADFVEEDRSLPGLFEEPFLIAGRAREGACLVAERVLSKSVSGKAPQLTATKGPLLATGKFVDVTGKHLLADAGFPHDEHGGIELCNPLGQFQDPQEAAAADVRGCDPRPGEGQLQFSPLPGHFKFLLPQLLG